MKSADTENVSPLLERELAQIMAHIPNRDAHDPKVSQVDVAWHLDHMLKTINKIYEALEGSNPASFASNISISRFFVYAFGDFPRGYAKAPKIVLPPEIITTESLYQQLEEAKESLRKWESLNAKSHFKHPYFNVINKKQSLRFLQIHTRHHLKIVRDILR